MISKSIAQEIYFKDLPAQVSNLLNEKGNFSSFKSSQFFGPVKIDIPALKIINLDKEVSYTIPLEDRTPGITSLYFDNLVIGVEVDSTLTAFVLRYEPSQKWYNGQRDFSRYTGVIAYYSLEGERLASMELYKGREVKNSQTKTFASCELERYKDGGWICTGGVYGTTDCRDTYEYKYVCDDGGTQGGTLPDDHDYDYGNDNPIDDNDGGTGTGGTGDNDSGDGGGVTTTPLLEDDRDTDEETIKINNNIDDPCASLIFNQLQLLSMDYDLPPDISNPDNVAEDIHFAEAILNLFNDSNEYDYIVEDDNNFNNINASASTNPRPIFNTETGRYAITTRFNTGYLQDATRLSMARTVIHESVHAYLVYEQRANPMGNLYEALLEYQRINGYFSSGNEIHHNFMADFVNAMAYTLYKWDHNHGTGGNLGWQYYHDMAWGGLITDNTGKFWDEFINHNPNPTDQNRIMDTVQNEANNTINSSGNGNECE